jgi:hypothetical protein
MQTFQHGFLYDIWVQTNKEKTIKSVVMHLPQKFNRHQETVSIMCKYRKRVVLLWNAVYADYTWSYLEKELQGGFNFSAFFYHSELLTNKFMYTVG